MRIVNIYQESFSTPLCGWLIGCIAVAIVVFLVISATRKSNFWSNIWFVILCLGIASFVASCILCLTSDGAPFKKNVTRYECVFDDGTDINDILDDYTIVKSNGMVVTLQERDK